MSPLSTDSIPPGLRVRCARAQIRPGMEAEAERWMQMLNDRHAEAVQTLERERVAVEIVFREREQHGEWLIWVMIQGEGGDSIGAVSDGHPSDQCANIRSCAGTDRR